METEAPRAETESTRAKVMEPPAGSLSLANKSAIEIRASEKLRRARESATAMGRGGGVSLNPKPFGSPQPSTEGGGIGGPSGRRPPSGAERKFQEPRTDAVSNDSPTQTLIVRGARSPPR